MFQRSDYRLPLNPADNKPAKPKRLIPSIDLPKYMHEEVREGADPCPFCGADMPEEVREAAAHILGCARDEAKHGPLRKKKRT